MAQQRWHLVQAGITSEALAREIRDAALHLGMRPDELVLAAIREYLARPGECSECRVFCQEIHPRALAR